MFSDSFTLVRRFIRYGIGRVIRRFSTSPFWPRRIYSDPRVVDNLTVPYSTCTGRFRTKTVCKRGIPVFSVPGFWNLYLLGKKIFRSSDRPSNAISGFLINCLIPETHILECLSTLSCPYVSDLNVRLPRRIMDPQHTTTPRNLYRINCHDRHPCGVRRHESDLMLDPLGRVAQKTATRRTSPSPDNL